MELHSLGASSNSRELIEAVHPEFLLEGLRRAQKKTIAVCDEIRREIKPGLTEEDARKLAMKVFSDHGVEKHWHRPYIRLGKSTMLTFRDPLEPNQRLEENEPFYVDLGPVWPDTDSGLEYEGDFGDTYVHGSNPEAERCVQTARALFKDAQQFWKTNRATGPEIYAFMTKEAQTRGYELLPQIDGHRISDFTHMKYSKERLAKVTFPPTEALWVLEVQIVDRAHGCGAFYEDLL